MIIMIEDTPLVTTMAIRQEEIIRVGVVEVDIIPEVATSITNLITSLIMMDPEEDTMIETKEAIRKKRNFQII